MRPAALLLLLSSVLPSLLGGIAGASAAERTVSRALDFDPLRAELPSEDLYMKVPGGALAVSMEGPAEAPVELTRALRDGGLVIGYCLKASCRYVTHLAVLQVCSNKIGGPTGSDRIVLGIVRLPYGRTPGYVKSLEGRDYAANFAAHGPVVQTLATRDDSGSGGFALSAVGKGPVAALAYEGLSIKERQSRETRALQLVRTRDRASGLQGARFEVRHLCQKHLS